VPKQRTLPGVRTERNIQSWPYQSEARPGPSSLASNGGDFVAARRSLLSRFAAPWLLEFHDLYPELYSQTAFETCLEFANEQDVDHEVLNGSSKAGRRDQVVSISLVSIFLLTHSKGFAPMRRRTPSDNQAVSKHSGVYGFRLPVS